MKRQGLPLRPTLLTVVVLLILTAAGVVGLLAYRSSQTIVSRLWSGYAEQIAQNTMQRSLRYFEPAAPYVHMTQRQVESGRLSVSTDLAMGQPSVELLEHFDAALAAHPEFTWASFGAADGTYVSVRRLPSGERRGLMRQIDASGVTHMFEFERSSVGEWRVLGDGTSGDYDPRVRPWYRAAAATETGVWVEPFLFATTKVPGFMYVQAQRAPTGELLGVWAVEHEVAHLSQFLATIEVGGHGQVYVITDSGLVVGHPGGETMTMDADGVPRVAVASDHPDPMLASAWEGLSRQERGAVSFASGPYLVMAEPFPPDARIDWQVLVVVSEKDFFSRVRSQALVTIVVAIIAAIMAALLGALFAGRVSGKLRRIAAQLDRVGKFDLDDGSATSPPSMVRELNEMQETTERMKRSLRSFGKFVPKELVRELLLAGTEAELGGRRADLTVLFTDIAGFTSIAESLDADILVELLGEYLETMSDAIRGQDGTVDKYIGDAIMAFWGAPRPSEQHALMACRGAIDMQRRLVELRAKWTARGAPDFDTRIGINTGDVVVGNIGSPERLNYTVIGDPVNVASRLEGLGKLYGVSIIIGPETAAQVAQEMNTRLLDWVTVKGKEKPLAIYELIGPREQLDAKRRQAHQCYARGLAAYRSRDFATAIDAFEECSRIVGGDRASDMMAERSREFAVNMPPEDWDGATMMTRK